MSAIETIYRIFDLTSDEQCRTCPGRPSLGKVLVEECGQCATRRVRKEEAYRNTRTKVLLVIIAVVVGFLAAKLNFPF